MLSRLSIRQKLTLLLVIPLTAVGLVMAGYAVERLNDARDHGMTARSAQMARNIGGLIDTLQQERLISVGYLVVPSLQRTALVGLTQTAVDDTVRLAADPLTAPVMANARTALDELTSIRRGVLNRAISAKAAYDAFRAVVVVLIDGLNLGNDATPDADSLRELVALDALMRANEEASSVGAILVAGSVDPALNASLLTEAAAADAQLLGRFSHLARPELASLVDLMDVGQAGQRIHHLVVDVTGGHPPAMGEEVSEALAAAITYTGLRRLAQDRIARDIADSAEQRAADAQVTAVEVVIGIIILFVGVVVLGVTVTRSISRPLRRLSRAATSVAELSRAELVRVADSDSSEQAPVQLASVEVDSADEIGELATALNRVQATAALLLERQVTTRNNVAVMFANIARRTQNLVGRQLTLIDELERNERDPELLQRLYRLDHVATRLRRSADSLLVVSGTIDQQLSGTPTRLADIVRSALAEIEGYRAVELGEIADVAVNADLVADLRLLLAELFENATNFSPPGTPVEVTSVIEHDCYVSVVDHGVGLSLARIEEENRRLVERERLDVAPTRVLGLFVVGRLARRHGLGVRLDPSEGRGVTATVRIPAHLLARPLSPVGPHVAPVPQRPAPALGVIPPMAIEAIQAAERTGPFPWLAKPTLAIGGSEPDETEEPAVAPVEAEATDVPDESLDEAWPGGVPSAPPAWPPTPEPEGDTVPDVDAVLPLPKRVASEDTDAITRASNSPVSSVVETSGEAAGLVAASPEPSHSGLSRRIPGTHLAEAVRDTFDAPPSPRTPRDPDAERDALNDYLSGLARGTAGPDEELESRPTTLAERHS
jgi:signal transduction histidine kinase